MSLLYFWQRLSYLVSACAVLDVTVLSTCNVSLHSDVVVNV